VRIELSADGGANFGVFGLYTPDVLSAVIPDLEPGVWVARGTVIDKAGAESKPVTASYEIVDTSPPGTLTLNLGPA
jgi:hypothetical protein